MIEVGRISPARRLSVLPSIMSSVRPLGTRVQVSVLIPTCIRNLPTRVLDTLAYPPCARGGPELTHARIGHPVGINDVLVGAPSDLECDVPLTRKQVE